MKDFFDDPIKITREWAMPNKNTFSIPPIRRLVAKHIGDGVWIDPFSRLSPFAHRCVTNDLNVDFPADSHVEALEFINTFADGCVDGALFDPPYSPRQISECYKGAGQKVHTADTQSSFYGDRKKALASKVKQGGKVLCFGWNSGGIGKTLGFKIIEILIVAHGGAHNDTICTVEVKF